MRFGLHTGQHRVPYPELRDLWRRAAGWGFDACYLFDHFRPLYSDVAAFLPEEAEGPEGPCFEAFALLGALAREVPDPNVGIMVASVGYRQVATLGAMIATLNQACAGRLEVGVGAGWFEPDYAPFGYQFDPPRERLARLEDTLRALVAWWAGDSATVEGLGLRDLAVVPMHPTPRLWVAGTGEKVILRLAARYADSWNAMYLTPEEFAGKVEVLGAHCDAAGRPLAKIERSIALNAFCSRDGTRGLARLAGLAALRGRDADEVRARSLAGSPEECIARIEAYRAAGATNIVVMAHPPYDVEGLETLAADVFPYVR